MLHKELIRKAMAIMQHLYDIYLYDIFLVGFSIETCIVMQLYPDSPHAKDFSYYFITAFKPSDI